MVTTRKTKVKKRDKEASKARLLNAGLEVFSKYGYDAATTKMVATKAKLNEQLITRYFGGKAGLLFAMLIAFMEKGKKDQDYPPAADNVESEIRNALLYRHIKILEIQEFLRIFIQRVLVDSSIQEKLQSTIIEHDSQFLVDRFLVLQKHGLIRKDVDLEKASKIVTGQSFYISFLLRVTTRLDDAYLTSMITEFAKYFARGLSPS